MNLQQEIISYCEGFMSLGKEDQNLKRILIKTCNIMKSIKLLPSDEINLTRSNADKNADKIEKGLKMSLKYLDSIQIPQRNCQSFKKLRFGEITFEIPFC